MNLLLTLKNNKGAADYLLWQLARDPLSTMYRRGSVLYRDPLLVWSTVTDVVMASRLLGHTVSVTHPLR